jgi:hypothetical protein
MRRCTSVAFVIIAFATASNSDDAFPLPAPEPEHAWLEQFVGEWTTTAQVSTGPDQPSFECSGKISSQMLGGLWVINDISNETPGMEMRGLQTIGYDPAKQKYVGTWVDSMMNHMWQYEGEVDESGKKIVLYAEGPNFEGGEEPAMFRDSYEFVSADEIRMTSEMQGADGEWITFTTGEAHRTSSAAERQ